RASGTTASSTRSTRAGSSRSGWPRRSTPPSPRRRSASSGCERSAVGYSVVNVDELEGAGPGGAVRFVRRELGVGAFGVNWFELPPEAVGREHDESASGQEEVNIVIAGSGRWRIDGEEVEVRPGTCLRFDPETWR